jgi:hypothetical protein
MKAYVVKPTECSGINSMCEKDSCHDAKFMSDQSLDEYVAINIAEV